MFSSTFRELLYEWHGSTNRTMPWLNEKNPYKIWISEIILQQTRVKQGLPYYLRFIESFPNLTSLANATEDEVLKNWEGLGYYSRARNLHATAQYISKQLNGNFPNSYDEIIKLKGIGPYTAAAISSFAFSLPHAVLDGNVHRVISRIYGIKTDIGNPKGRNEIQSLADDLLDVSNPGKFNQAIMDFGATVCVPTSPNCEACLLSDHCNAYLTDRQSEFPLKKQKAPLKNRYFHLFLLEKADQIILTQRKGKDIWKGLYTFPFIETTDEKLIIVDDILQIGKFKLSNSEIKTFIDKDKQMLTHQKIHIYFHHSNLENSPSSLVDDNYIQIPIDQIHAYALPKFLNRFIEKNNPLFHSK